MTTFCISSEPTIFSTRDYLCLIAHLDKVSKYLINQSKIEQQRSDCAHTEALTSVSARWIVHSLQRTEEDVEAESRLLFSDVPQQSHQAQCPELSRGNQTFL